MNVVKHVRVRLTGAEIDILLKAARICDELYIVLDEDTDLDFYQLRDDLRAIAYEGEFEVDYPEELSAKAPKEGE